MNTQTQNKPNHFAFGTTKIQVFCAKTIMEVVLKTHTGGFWRELNMDNSGLMQNKY